MNILGVKIFVNILGGHHLTGRFGVFSLFLRSKYRMRIFLGHAKI